MSEEKNNKKVIIISAIIAIIIIMLGLAFFLLRPQNLSEIQGDKIKKLYESLKQKEQYSFEAISDKDNKVYFERTTDKSYLDETIDGKETKMIVKDGNTYLLVDEDKAYYTYRNNNSNLNQIEEFLEEIKDSEYEVGKEKINNKTYTYIEIPKVTKFVTIKTAGSKNIKTRFYFDGDKLEYIKTMADKKEETIKVTISDKIDNSLFEIPKDYKEK